MFATSIVYMGHSVARRETLISLSSCSWGGTILSWFGLRWASVYRLGWESKECVP
jgi:hypothetical protein